MRQIGQFLLKLLETIPEKELAGDLGIPPSHLQQLCSGAWDPNLAMSVGILADIEKHVKVPQALIKELAALREVRVDSGGYPRTITAVTLAEVHNLRHFVGLWYALSRRPPAEALAIIIEAHQAALKDAP